MVEKPQRIRKLTEKQGKILEFIADYIDGHSYPPSIREVGDHFGIKSTNGVFDHLNALVRKGYVSREYFTARSITILLDKDGNPFLTPTAREVTKLFGMLAQYELDASVKKQIKKIQGIIQK